MGRMRKEKLNKLSNREKQRRNRRIHLLEQKIEQEKKIQMENERKITIKNLNSKCLIKFLKSNFNHNGFIYKPGLNILKEPFQAFGSCKPGGLYFTDIRFHYKWKEFGIIMASVTLPEDAKVYQEPCGTKYKADRIILSNFMIYDSGTYVPYNIPKQCCML